MRDKDFYEIAKRELPNLSDDEIWYVIWNETGYPEFFDGDIKKEFTKQIIEFKKLNNL